MFKNKIISLFIGLGLLISSVTTPNPIGGNGIIIGSIATLGVVAAYEHYRYDDFQSDNGLYISPGLDPKMLSELKLDVRQKVYYKYNRFNPYIVWETFGWAEYESYSTGLDYCMLDKKLSLLTGFETGVIYNQNKYVWSHGVNLELRLYTKNNYSISYIINIDSSPELVSKDYRYNAYLHLNIKLD